MPQAAPIPNITNTAVNTSASYKHDLEILINPLTLMSIAEFNGAACLKKNRLVGLSPNGLRVHA
jgi:hypothetical protein